mgnify:CR=1 FL=1
MSRDKLLFTPASKGADYQVTLRIADLARSSRRPWWRNLAFGLVRTPTEVRADLGVQYLGHNIHRARDHWRQALAHRDELHRLVATNDVINRLGEELHGAFMDEVLPELQHDAIPYPIAQAATHLARVVEWIRECDRLVVSARNRLMLQRMGDGGPDG